jgi:hypothetical protein
MLCYWLSIIYKKNKIKKYYYKISFVWISIYRLLYIIYNDDTENNKTSDEPRTNNGVSNIIWLYVTHNDDDAIFINEKINE